MKKKCVFVGFLFVIVWSITACGATFVTQTVEAGEPEILAIKDERVMLMEQSMDSADDKELLQTESVEEVAVEEAVVEEKRFAVNNVAVEEMYVVLPSENVEELANARVDEEDFAAEIEGTLVGFGEEIQVVLDKLGGPDSFNETVSNPSVGSEKSYTYDGIVIYTTPKNGKDLVSGITYQGEEKTLSGIGVGSTRADIEAAYGIHYMIEPDYIIYQYGENAILRFCMNGEECKRIEICWK